MFSSLAYYIRPAGWFHLSHLISSGFLKAPAPPLAKPVKPFRYRRRHGGATALQFLAFTASMALAGSALSAQMSSNVEPQNPLKTMTIEQLGSIEVTTFSKVPSPLHNTPAALYVITREEILRSGVTTIPDALRLAPGVEVGRLSSTTWAVSIRGLQNNFSKSVLVLIDGRNVYTPLFAGVYWDVQDLPLGDIDRIEVIRGPAGTIWGPNSANGVINIITRKASDSRGVLGSALVGNIDHTIDDLQIGAGSGDTSFRIFGRGFERAHEYHSDGIDDDTWHEERLGFRVDRDKEKVDLMLEGDLYKGTSPHIVGTAISNDQTSGGDVNFRYQNVQASGTGLTVQAYFDRTLRTRGFLGETRDTIDFDFVDRFLAGGSQLLSVGAGLRWSPFNVISTVVGEGLAPSTGVDHIYTGFLQDEIRFGQTVNLTLGAKLQQNNYSGFDALPSGRLLWSPNDRQSLWAGITRSVTTPSDIEENFLLEGITPTLVIQVLGNHHFKSEDVMGYELGYRGTVNAHLYFDVSGFWNQYSGLQSFGPAVVSKSGSTTYITIQYTNQISGSASGFEIAPQAAIGSAWRLNLAYSFLNSDFQAAGPTSSISSTGSVSTYDGSSPKHQVVLQSMIDLPWKLQFDQTYRFISALPAQKVPAYQTADLHVSRPLGGNFLIEAAGQNLFQPHHCEWGTGDPSQPPVGIYRAGYIRLSFHASKLK
jgi:iron complex outermembrane receptor protein